MSLPHGRRANNALSLNARRSSLTMQCASVGIPDDPCSSIFSSNAMAQTLKRVGHLFHSEENPMRRTEESIDVNVPISIAYNQWTQFEAFPRFMDAVKEVRQLDDTHLHWRAEIGGKEVEWDAEITDQTPDTRIAWKSISGAENGGAVLFEPLGGSKTRVTVRMNYEPQGVIENVGSAVGFPGMTVSGDLDRFKRFIESQGAESGAWRGEVHGDQVRK
jgi:uncharacterized membrane protein